MSLRKILKWTGIGLAAIFALGVIGAIMDGGGEVEAVATTSTTVAVEPTTTTTSIPPTTTTTEPRIALENDLLIYRRQLGISVESIEQVWGNCTLEINFGLIRSGWKAELSEISQESSLIPYGSFTKGQGERFNSQTHAVESISVICDDPYFDVGIWGWE